MSHDQVSRIEYLLLGAIAASKEPLGAGTLCALLEDRDIDISEATVGRYLKQFERQGYLVSSSFKGRPRGRLLTEEGQKRLRELNSTVKQVRSIGEMLQLLREGESEQLKNLLKARAILEPENAALAAENATEEDLRYLRETLNDMDQLVAKGESMAVTDTPFHVGIARASGNPVLEFALKIIRLNQDYSPVIEYIRQSGHGKIDSDHWKIYHAIAAHDAEKARQLMKIHIQNMLLAVDAYEKQQNSAQ